MGTIGKITRRTFLVASVGIAGGVVFGYWKYKQPHDNPLNDDIESGDASLTPYILIDRNGINIVAPRAEMGQGVSTTLAALVAEELDVSLENVNSIHGPASKAYYNAVVLEEGLPFAATDHGAVAESVRKLTKVPAKFVGMQITGGSSSVADAFEKMRVAGAAAREVLIKAAAQKWQLDEASLVTNNGEVVAPDGSKLTYLELAADAALIEPPAEPTLKSSSDWKLLGKSQERVDMVAKSTGVAEFSIDVELPEMLHAAVRMKPSLGAPLESYKASKAESMPGVKRIVPIDNGVAAIASNTWYAFQAVKAVDCTWADADYAQDTAGLFKDVENSFSSDHQDSQLRDDGDVTLALDSAADILSGEYRVPYLAHAAMEPPNAVAWFRDGKLDVWAGNQIPTQALKEGAAIVGIDESDVRAHTTLMGGSFGRRLELDFVTQAIKIAKALEGTPVKTTWSREEDTTHDFYRPLAIARFKATMGSSSPSAFDLKLAAPSVVESQMGRLGVPLAGPDVSIVQAAWDQPYSIEHYRVTGYRTPTSFPVSSWRSVGASQNGFFHECIIDEMAHSKGLDPLQMRLDMMAHEPSRKVLKAVQEMSGWGSPLPEGHGRGVAFVLSFGVPSAQVIEVANTERGIKIVHAWAAVDVGIALDPSNIEAQVFGGMNFGLAAAMMGEITIKEGQVQQSNFHNYNSIRINQAPPVEVKILQNGEKIRGIGEPGLPPAAPALANAIFAATGNRVRELPLNKHIKFFT